MSAKSKYIPTVKAITFHDCPQVMGKLRTARKAKAKRVKKARSVHRRRLR